MNALSHRTTKTFTRGPSPATTVFSRQSGRAARQPRRHTDLHGGVIVSCRHTDLHRGVIISCHTDHIVELSPVATRTCMVELSSPVVIRTCKVELSSPAATRTCMVELSSVCITQRTATGNASLMSRSLRGGVDDRIRVCSTSRDTVWRPAGHVRQEVGSVHVECPAILPKCPDCEEHGGLSMDMGHCLYS